MASAFEEAKSLAQKTVKMRFDDGVEVVARLHSAVTDLDGSEHLIYEEISAIAPPDGWLAAQSTRLDTAMYSSGESLLSIEEVGQDGTVPASAMA